jgi:hypothetical protein
MDMKIHILILFFVSMLVDMGKEWDSYKMEVAIRKGGRLLLMKLIKKRSSY